MLRGMNVGERDDTLDDILHIIWDDLRQNALAYIHKERKMVLKYTGKAILHINNPFSYK